MKPRRRMKFKAPRMMERVYVSQMPDRIRSCLYWHLQGKPGEGWMLITEDRGTSIASIAFAYVEMDEEEVAFPIRAGTIDKSMEVHRMRRHPELDGFDKYVMEIMLQRVGEMIVQGTIGHHRTKSRPQITLEEGKR